MNRRLPESTAHVSYFLTTISYMCAVCLVLVPFCLFPAWEPVSSASFTVPSDRYQRHTNSDLSPCARIHGFAVTGSNHGQPRRNFSKLHTRNTIPIHINPFIWPKTKQYHYFLWEYIRASSRSSSMHAMSLMLVMVTMPQLAMALRLLLLVFYSNKRLSANVVTIVYPWNLCLRIDGIAIIAKHLSRGKYVTYSFNSCYFRGYCYYRPSSCETVMKW